MDKLLIAGLLLSTSVFALPNSHTIIINTTRANINNIEPAIDCWRGKLMPIEIIKESDTLWKIDYETPERLVDCSIKFKVSYGDNDPCVYDLDVSFMIGNGMEPSPDFGFIDYSHIGKLNPVSAPFPYCPSLMSARTDWPKHREENTTNLYL